MANDHFMRRVLTVAAVVNLGGALLFAFPASIGQLAGLPAPVPALYTALVAFFVALFAGAYAWLARQPRISRAFVAFAMLGKGGAVTLVFILWRVGQASGLAALAFSADLVFALIFAGWLLAGSASSAPVGG